MSRLTPHEALELFAAGYGRDSTHRLTLRERAAAEEIVGALEYENLAIKLASAYAADAHCSLTDFAREVPSILRNAAGSARDMTVAVLQFSLRTLSEATPARTLFSALAVFATSDFGQEATRAVAQELTNGNPDTVVEPLVRRALLEPYVDEQMMPESDRHRYRIDALLHCVAREEFASWGDQARRTAYLILAEWYADYTITAPPLNLETDEANIVAILEWLRNWRDTSLGRDQLLATLCDGMRIFWRDAGRIEAGLTYLPLGLAAAQRASSEAPSDQHTFQAANIAVFYGDLLESARRLAEAKHLYAQDLRFRQAVKDRAGEGTALFRLGLVALDETELDLAEAYFRQSLVIDKELGDRHSEGLSYSLLGQVAHARGHLDEAVANYQQALAISREVQNRHNEGDALSNLGQVAYVRRDLDQAARTFQEALLIAQEAQNIEGVRIGLLNLGHVAVDEERWTEADEHFQRAHADAQQAGDRLAEGEAVHGLARIADKQGRLEQAESLYRESLTIALEVQAPRDIADASFALGVFLLTKRDEHDEGCRLLHEALRIREAHSLAEAERVREKVRALGCLEHDSQ